MTGFLRLIKVCEKETTPRYGFNFKSESTLSTSISLVFTPVFLGTIFKSCFHFGGGGINVKSLIVPQIEFSGRIYIPVHGAGALIRVLKVSKLSSRLLPIHHRVRVFLQGNEPRNGTGVTPLPTPRTSLPPAQLARPC